MTLHITSIREMSPMEAAARDLLRSIDGEEGVIRVGQDAGCPMCTSNAVPYDRTTGICAYHRLQRALREGRADD